MTTMPKFSPGQIVATPGALSALEQAGQSANTFLARHLEGDWGDVDTHDRSSTCVLLPEEY